MKILQLELKAFGPFAGQSLEFTQGKEGLHLVFGANEAGKSSALRAIGNLLYGIPARTPDSFIHPYGSLRVGAVLQHSDGRTLQVLRRKGNRSTLRGADDQAPIDDGELERFLGGVDEDMFHTMFGIDHARLQRGGQEILSGGGRLGELLFSAGAGIADLRATQQQLEAEMDSLFKSTGRNPQVNQAIQALKESRTALKQAQLSVEEWRTHDEALRTAQDRKHALDRELLEKESRQQRLIRLRDALPAIGQWKSARAGLEQFADAPSLPADFSRRHGEALIRWKKAEQQRDDAEAELEGLREELKSLQVPHELLAEADAVEQLRTDLGSHRKAMRDRPGIVTECETAERDAQEILRKLGHSPDFQKVESLRVPEDRVVRIQNLGNQREGLVQRREAMRREGHRRRQAIEQAEQELEQLGCIADAGPLQKAVRQIQQRCEMESQLQARAAEVEKLAEQAAIELERLGLFQGTLADLERLPMPALDTIDRFDAELKDRLAQVEAHRKEKESVARALAQVTAELDHLEREQSVPTESDVAQARHLRDQGWQLVLASWQTGDAASDAIADFVNQFPSAADLAEAYRASVEQADRLVDRLRREADRVARKAALQADCDRRRQELEATDRRIASAENKLKETRAQWCQSWSATGIEPLSPREMRSWHRNQQRLAAMAADLRTKEAEKRRVAQQIEADRAELSKLLQQYEESPAAAGESLGDLLQRAQDRVDRLQRLRTRREQLEERLATDRAELEEAEADYREAEQAWHAWQNDWAKEMTRLRLEEDATPAQANTVLTMLNQLFQKQAHADRLRLRIEGIDKDSRQFEAEVAYVAGRVAPEWAGERADEIVEQLKARLDAAKTVRSRHESLSRQRTAAVTRLQQAKDAISAVEAEFRAMCQQASCESAAELPAAEERSERRREFEAKLRDLEAQLGHLCGGKELSAFVAEVEAEVDEPDELQPRISDLAEEISRLHAQREELVRTIEREHNALSRMDGSATASERAAECENLVARLEEQLTELAILRVAAGVLRGGIERFREKNQGPILERASRLFSQMTHGSFEALRTDFDERGEPILTGARPGGEEVVGVEGMSDGTCDQLYLALRVASLETWLKHHEPIPFIVDDVLLNFDDERAAAALGVLGALSCYTQVIFFTHHGHLVDLAKEHLPAEVLFVHELNNGSGCP